jgi:hypothetical protein
LVDLIEKNAKEVALRAWQRPLESSEHAQQGPKRGIVSQ